MSESKLNPKKIEFETKKKLLELVVEDITCYNCEIVPREAPIYHTNGGKILCFSCSETWEPPKFREVVTVALEKLLFELPIPCKFKKSGCKVAMELKNSIEYHEEDCIFRDIQCFYNDCDDIHPYENLSEHLKSKHKFDIMGEKFSPTLKFITCRISVPNEKKSKLIDTFAAVEQFHKTFVPQIEIDNEKNNALVWLMIYGSQFEAKNFKYEMECEDIELGTFCYKNYVKSLDDNRKDICNSMACLRVPAEMFWKHLGGKFVLKITIENLKEEEEEPDFDDQEFETPLAKKCKGI